MELERYLRDAKAGWVMGPTNEVLRQFVGKAALLGFESLDYWNQVFNRRAVENEFKKLDADGKRELAEQLLAERGEGAGAGVAPMKRGRSIRPLLSDLARETYRVAPGGATVVRHAGDHQLRIVDRQRPGRRGLGVSKRSDTSPAAPTGNVGASCSGRESPPGDEEDLRRRPGHPAAGRCTGRPVVEGELPREEPLDRVPDGPSPRRPEEVELPPPLAEPRLHFQVDAATAARLRGQGRRASR